MSVGKPYKADDIIATELVEIGDVVDYVKQNLMDKIRQYFAGSGQAYKPASVLGTDKYDVGSDKDNEYHRYFDATSTIINDEIGGGSTSAGEFNRKGNLIKASEIVQALQSLVSQLARLRIFSTSGQIKYKLTGNCSKGDCPQVQAPKYKVDKSIEATTGYTFLPAKSEAYTGNIQKTVGATVRTDAVTNTKSISTNAANYGIAAGNVITARNFKEYILALYNEWQTFISNNTITYFSETCYKSQCNFSVTHCYSYSSCDGRSRR